MATSPAEGEGSTRTNWIVVEGSLEDCVSIETPSTSADDAAPGGVVLRRPSLVPSDGPLPCEITIYFQEKHEIYMVYVRSSARVYEIYYAFNPEDDSNEYLCTVQCGPAVRKMTTKSDFTESQKGDHECSALPEQVVRPDNTNNDDDGWVEVKAPDSLLRDDQKILLADKVDQNTMKIMQKLQVHYEATAQISDARPCVSLTLRLLSLDVKESVHVEEIYIYADPVLSISPDPPMIKAGNTGASSLLAMLVPSLRQMSESGSSKIQDQCISSDSGFQKFLSHAKKEAETPSFNMEGMVHKSHCSHSGNESTKVRCECFHSGSTQEVTGSDQISKPVVKEDNLASCHVEKVLDELVSRVGRIETFCLRFEENLMKPLGSIEMRLQRLEQQLEAFTMRNQFPEPVPGSKNLAPEVPLDGSNLESEDCLASQKLQGGSAIHEPSPVPDDVAITMPSSEPSSVPDDVATSMPASEQMSTYFVVKAPEFSNEENEHNSSELVDECPKAKASLSIDDALASALAAFVTSTTVTSPRQKPTSGQDIEFSDGNENAVAYASAKEFCEGADKVLSTTDSNDSCCITESVKERANTSEYKESAAFDDTSVLAGEALNPVFDMGPGLAISAPEFLSEEEDSTNQDQTSDLWVRESMNNSAFAAFLSASMVASHFSNDDNNVLHSSGPDCYEEIENLGTGNQQNDKNLNAESDSNPEFLQGKSIMEQTTYDKVSHLYSVGGTVEGSAPKYVHPEEKEQNFVWRGCRSAYETEDIPLYDCCVGVESTEALDPLWSEGLTGNNDAEEAAVGGLHMNHFGRGWTKGSSTNSSTYGIVIDEKAETKWSEGLTGDSDAEEAAVGGLHMNHFGRGWMKDSSTHSSTYGILIDEKAETKWSDKSSTGSNEQAVDNDWSTQVTVVSFDNHGNADESSAGYTDKMGKAELEGDLNSLPDLEHPLLDVDFSPNQGGTSEALFEFLLGEMNSLRGRVDINYFNSFPFHYVDQHAVEEHLFIPELQDQIVPTTASSFGSDALPGRGISSHEVFSSLI